MASLNPEFKQQLDEMVEKYLADRYDFEARQQLAASDSGYSSEHWQQFAKLGWLSIPFSEECGGADGDVYDTLEMMSLFGRALLLEPFVSTIGLVGSAIAQGSNERLKTELLPQLIAGEKIASLAFEESGSRGNPACVAARAEAEGEAYRLSGEKLAVLNAPQADFLLVSARSAGGTIDEEGISLFLLPVTLAGIEMQSYSMVDGHRGANVRFDVSVGADSLVCEAGKAFSVLSATIDQGLLMLSAEAIGIMQALLDTTIEYTNTRKQFGTSLASFQELRHRMVDMYIEKERASSLLKSVVAAKFAGTGLDGSELHQLKAQIGRSGRAIGDDAIQLHGGMGMTDELNVGHYVKRLISISQLLGNSDYHLKRVWEKKGALLS